MEIRECSPEDIIAEEPLGEKAKSFINRITTCVTSKSEEYNTIISENLKGWKLERVSKLSISAIKLALAEIQTNEKITPPIAISEAIKLISKYEGEEAASFVNGVLGEFMRSSK